MKYDHIHIGIGNARTGVGTHIFDIRPRVSVTIPLGDGTELVVERRVVKVENPKATVRRWCTTCRRDDVVCEHWETKEWRKDCPWWQSGEVK